VGGRYAVVILVSSVYSTDPGLADERLTQALRGLALAVLLVHLVRTPPQLDAILWVIIGAAAILATLTIVQVATGSYQLNFGGLARVKNAQIVGNVFERRVAGPLSDPNFYAQILLIAVPMALFRFWEAKRLIFRVLIGAVLVLINVAIVFTYSRAVLIAAGMVYLIAAIWMRVRPRHILSFALVAVLTVVIMPGDAAKRFDTLTQILPWAETAEAKIDTSFQERTMLMRTAVEMFSDQPLLGVGAGNYTSNFDRYAPSVGSNVSSYEGFDKRRFPHNLYLETAAELGIVGLFVLIALISTAVVYAAVASRDLKERGQTRSSRSAAAIAISIIGYGMTSLFLHGDYMQYLWLLVGLAIAARHIAIDETVEEDSLIGNAGASA
jgi:putative inorganic carbon (hco3(-)) transporter